MRVEQTNFSLILVILLGMSGEIYAQSSAQEIFFENRIRPLLIERCYACHSQEAQANNELKGSLLLDSAEAIRQGGDSGSAIDATNIDSSLLLSAIRYEGLEMPPDGKLSDAEIADIRKWIVEGAFHSGKPPKHTKDAVGKPTLDMEAAKRQWPYFALQRPFALQQPFASQQPVPPTTSTVPTSTVPDTQTTPDTQTPDTQNVPPQDRWGKSPIDHYLWSTAANKSLRPNVEMDRARLARRLYYDLIGLPPSPEQLEYFLRDNHPDAYERLVDQLLASPHFGIRWGRNWLDIVRYAESTTLRGLIYSEAWRYRDYVIESIQEDRPLDQMIREHVAGDLLPSDSTEEQARGLIATTFLTLGNHNLEEQDKQQLRMDVVDEQLDVIGQAFLGQTLGCARCHDHKFDPIPTKDYYAMAGILRNVQTLKDANVSNWITRPLPISADEQTRFERLQNELTRLDKEIKDTKNKLAKLGTDIVSEAVPLNKLQGVVVDDSEAQLVGSWTESKFVKPYLGNGYRHDDNAQKGEKTITFSTNKLSSGTYEVRLAYSPGGGRGSRIPVTVASADGEKGLSINQRQKPDIAPCFISLGSYRFESGGQAYVLISTGDTDGHVTADAVQFLPQGQVDSVSRSEPDAATVSGRDSERKMLQAHLSQMEGDKKSVQAQYDRRPQAMSILERADIEEPYVNIRGVVHSRGATVKRGFLSVAGGDYGIEVPGTQSGRAQLADWLVASENPLTPRVMANRIWAWTMGVGLARNPDHLGPSSEPPVHPELIDYLACELKESNWSLKKLVRSLVLSDVYRQSTTSAGGESDDPENRFWMRGHKKYLTAESMRDSMLQIAGQLDHRMFGSELSPLPAADYGFEAKSPKRSVFLPMLRNSLPKLLVAFDMADPSRVTGSRNQSIVAPQALLMLNSEEVTKLARSAAENLLRLPLTSMERRLEYAFRQTLMREPTAAERRLFLDFVQEDSESIDVWQDIYQTLFGSAEFRSLE